MKAWEKDPIKDHLAPAEREEQTYDADEHRHRFAVWAAARAAQRGAKGLSVKVFSRSLLNSGLRSEFRIASLREDWSAESYDKQHRVWVDRLQCCANVPSLTFGRAAKFIAIYIKTVFSVDDPSRTAFLNTAHPPVDAILLDSVKAKVSTGKGGAEALNIKWTKARAEEYYAAIGALRRFNDENPFWMVEQHWNPERD